ncbi:hypothetical protein BDV25DRAFT_137581 [Aspergillus avenaceus]|uniref:Uncharacterized protein n=1 Tax=Aspergillus avenaceus TaxID=36643 RepID=A0A5N6U2B8_ASPAV|nr:hypothetical protein BDV25DRAFT_137581 [Aspergillus avenaceus]
MIIFLGKLNYSPYASDEIFSVIFRDNIQPGDRVSVILQWSKDGSGRIKANSSNNGTISKVSHNGDGEKEIEFLYNEKDTTYYWYKGRVSGHKLILSMWNKSGEEVAKDIQLNPVFF